MFDTIANGILESLSDVSQNPVALVIFGLITIVIFLLILAMSFPSWRRFLISIQLLEEKERPGSLLLWIVSVIVIVKILQIYIIQPFVVDGGSMLPTFHNAEFLLVDKFSYTVGTPHRGDVMIFKLYEDPTNPYNGKYLIKRVIGLPGERVVVRNGITHIFNKAYPEGLTLDESYILYKDIQKNVDVTLDDHHYFVMGDNRAQSYDSRDWGPLDASQVKGQVLLRVYPLGTLSYEPGRHPYSH